MSRSFWLGVNAGATNWLWLTLLIIGADQWTKWLIVQNFELFDVRVILPVLNIVRLHNEGAAFSFLSDATGWQRWFFIALGVIVSLVVLVWLRRLPAKGQHVVAAGLACIIGGALGNVIDRAVRGYVVDFIQVHYRDWYFPSFNVADSAITVGAALLIIDNLIEVGQRRRYREPHQNADG